jgi:anthranilate phosphoribosyltransferase
VTFAEVMARVLRGRDLDESQMQDAVGALVDGRWTTVQSAGFLTALAAKGEALSELVGAARAMRERAVIVDHRLPLVVDVCGTGGDAAGTINISTCAAFVVAACGVPVAKHGNRAASSRCGSADVLEHLGVPIGAAPDRARLSLESDNFTFLFAQHHHPAMKSVAPIRRELGVRTIFNIVGPLVNPARACRQIVGVARPEHVELIAKALRELGTEAAAVVHAESGIDEIGPQGRTRVYQFCGDVVERYEIDPTDFGIHAANSAIAGGDPAENAAALFAILDGERSARADVVALNAALALLVARRAATLSEGFELARFALRGGRARAVLERARAQRPQ